MNEKIEGCKCYKNDLYGSLAFFPTDLRNVVIRTANNFTI